LAITQLQKQAIVYQIIKTHGVGPISFWKEFNKSKNFCQVFQAFQTRFYLESIDKGVQEIQQFNSRGIACIGFWQPEYPKQLKRLHDVPPIIWAKGQMELLHDPQLAIVGGRNVSFHGVKFAKDISHALSAAGFTIVSGLARGIDKAAHQGALHHRTIAVLAGGVDRLYPQENVQLYEELLHNHLVVSEMPPGTEPAAELFPRRNRIIAGLSSGICIIEAAFKSGSLLTAKYGLDINLPIFACPGHPYDPRTKGSNMLIKDGAFLLENVQDVLDQISLSQLPDKPIEQMPMAKIQNSNKLAQEILNYVNHTPVKVDELLKNLNHYSIEQVLITLSELELNNAIFRPSANLIVLA
jgi:DNA processing protein